MKKKLFFKLFIFAVIGAFVTITSCKDYGDDIDRLDADLTALKNSALEEADLTALQTQLTSSISAVQAELNTAKTNLAALQASAATKAEVDAAKADVLAKVVTLETYNTYKAWVDGEIATLKTDLAKAASKEEVEALATLLNSEIASVRTDLSLTVSNLEALTEIVEGNSDAIADVETALAEQLTEIEANAAEITVVKADLQEKYAELTADIDTLKLEIAEIKTDMTAFNEALDSAVARLDDIDTEIEAINGRIDDLEELLGGEILSVSLKVNNMITEVTFDYVGDDWVRDFGVFDLDFTTTPARVTATFAPNVVNPITFVKNQRQASAGIKITVKISPANADLSTMLDKIKLIRSDNNAEINSYVHATAAVRATKLLTRATPTVTGLWDITFELPTSADLTAFRNLIKSPAPENKQYLFALAIENTVDEAEDAADRFVISDFAIAMSADDITPIYNSEDPYSGDLTFQARGTTTATWTNHTALRNRHGWYNSISGNYLYDKQWSGTGWSSTATSVDDYDDWRRWNQLLNVEVGKEFNVRLSPQPNDIYAYFVTLDSTYAIESNPSELNAWLQYQYEGLNTVYKANEVAKLKINSAAATGDIIGFRIYAVNWDGTLVDPDGKSFYVGVGVSPSTEFAFKQTITDPLSAGESKASDILTFTPPTGVAIYGQEFTMTIGHSVELNINNIKKLAADGTTEVSNWSDTKKLQIIGVIPADLEENKTYTGTLKLKNAQGIDVFVQNVTLQKVLPTADLGITYKSNIHHDVAGQQVVYGYPLPSSYYDVTTALNVPGIMTDLVVTNASTYPATSLPNWNLTAAFGNTAANIPVTEIGVPYLPAAAPGHGKIYALTLKRNYGPVIYDADPNAGPGDGLDHEVTWNASPALKVEFRSYVQDLTDWLYTGTNQANTPVLKYGANLTGYSLTKITAMPPAGARINLTNTTPALQDGRSFIVTGVRVLTGATFTIANEYFVPTLVGTPATAIDFTAVITSVPASPVPTKLEVTLQDNFGHSYTFVVPKVFNMTPN